MAVRWGGRGPGHLCRLPKGVAAVVSGSSWILATGFWDDTGVWDDSASWID
jgi:hypothetical protein